MERGCYTRQNHVQPHMRLLTSVRQARSYLESRSCWRNKRQTKEISISKGLTFIISVYKCTLQIRRLSFTAEDRGAASQCEKRLLG